MYNDFKRNGSGYYDGTAYKAIMNVERTGTNMDVYRGDIFYIKKGGVCVGSEQYQERPAVIVSNDIGNEHSSIVEVVYLTTQPKKELPTHVRVMCSVPSTALCEQVNTVSKERLGGYVRSCTDAEMDAIDNALLISLGIKQTELVEYDSCNDTKATDQLEEKVKELTTENEIIKAENKLIRSELENLSDCEFIKLQTERDLYKSLYEQTFERLIG